MPEARTFHPIEYSVGAHSADNTMVIPSLYKRIRATIESGQNVAYVLEGGELSEHITTRMHTLYDKGRDGGILPSHAYVAGLYVRIYGKMPETEEAFSQFYSNSFAENSGVLIRFRQEELRMLDDVARFYPHRLSIFVARNNKGLDDGLVDLSLAKELVFEGQFDQALPLFQAGVQSLLKTLPSLEEDVHNKAIDAGDEKTTVFVRIGAGHTFAAHRLQKEGYPVAIHYDWKTPQTAYLFDPIAQLYRRDYLSPRREIPELMWQRSLIGDSIEDVIQVQSSQYAPDSDLFLTEQEQVSIALEIMDRLKTQEEVDAFVARVKQTNFHDVVGELFQEMLLEYEDKED